VELAFDSTSLRTLCEDADRAANGFGEVVVESLKARLADLRAAEWIGDLVAGNPSVSDARRPAVTIGLAGGYELICEVNDPSPRQGADGRVDMRRVRRLRVTAIRPESPM